MMDNTVRTYLECDDKNTQIAPILMLNESPKYTETLGKLKKSRLWPNRASEAHQTHLECGTFLAVGWFEPGALTTAAWASAAKPFFVERPGRF